MTSLPELPGESQDDTTRIIRPPPADEATRVTATPAFSSDGQGPTGAHAASTIAIGSVLSHTYVIEAFLARGGMGEVYRARHQELGSIHAIKVILPELTQNPGVVTMFTEEARKLRRVREDGVVAYEGLFRDEAGRLYLVMEFADGPSLSQVLRERRLSVSEVRLLRDRLALGLAAAHDKGIFHRDLSPDNVILVDGKTELAKVIDFGIAKSSEPDEVTVVGQDFAGKYSWVAPEQLGLYGGNVDARTDIYSLGLVLGAAASGRTLTPCSTMADVIMTRQKVPDLTGVPPELQPEIAPLLQPDPARRPTSMAELPRAAAKRAGPSAKDITSSTKTKGSKTIVMASAVAAALAIAGIAAFFFLRPASVPSDHSDATAQAPSLTASSADASRAEVAGGAALHPASGAESISRPEPVQIAQRITPELASFDCANITAAPNQTSVALTGFVKSAADKERLGAMAATLASGVDIQNQVQIVPFPFCAADRLGPLVGASSGLGVQVDHPDATYRIGDAIIVTAKPPPGVQHGWISVDLIDAQGNVAHMVPVQGSDGVFSGSRAIKIGAPRGQPGAWLASDPPGPVMVLAVASDRQLERPRMPVEDATSYFPWLEQSLRGNGGQLYSTAVNVNVVKN
jgi:serine/threonine protein kinase